jgi:hypothetical protein
MRRLFAVLALGIIGCTNPSTPAGYVGYVTKHPYTMPARFYELQTGPTSTGLGWMLDVTNISVTPNTSTEQFVGPDAVLAKDNLRIEFRAHLLWKIDPENVRIFVEKFGETGENPLGAATTISSRNRSGPTRETRFRSMTGWTSRAISMRSAQQCRPGF